MSEQFFQENLVTANYALIDDQGEVINVIVVDTALCPDEASALAFVNSGLETPVAQVKESSTRNDGFRYNPALIGGTYDTTADAFIHPRPIDRQPSFVLDTSTYTWVAPVAKPSLPGNIPSITFFDSDVETAFNSSWDWVWNETKVAWELINEHPRSVLDADQLAVVQSYIESISDVGLY